MRTIYKYPLVNAGIIKLPIGFIARHVADQLGQPTAWIESDDSHSVQEWQIIRVPTGSPLPQNEMIPVYLGTLLESHGMYVWHYYVVRRA